MAHPQSKSAGRFLSPRRPATWFIAAALALGLVLQAPNIPIMFSNAPGAALIALGGGVVQALLLLVAAWLVLPRGRIRVLVVLVAAALGLLPAMGIASMLNTLAGAAWGETGSLSVAPLVEEPLKLGCAALVLWGARRLLRGPLDGFVIGFFTGLGFEVFEDVTYSYNAGAAASGDIGTVVGEIVTRTLLGFGLHNMFTAITAAALAALILGRRAGWGIALGGLVLSIAMHWCWDNIPLPLFAQLAEYAVIVAVFFVVRARCVRSDRIEPASDGPAAPH